MFVPPIFFGQIPECPQQKDKCPCELVVYYSKVKKKMQGQFRKVSDSAILRRRYKNGAEKREK
jgi:hypothetical protein